VGEGSHEEGVLYAVVCEFVAYFFDSEAGEFFRGGHAY